MPMEQIKCKKCDEYVNVQIGTEQCIERICYDCVDNEE